MTPIRIFISSVQKEFLAERILLRDYLRNDSLLRRFCQVFLFEDVPAHNRRADELYLEEVDNCSIYVGLFGANYGIKLSDGLSPTHKEFKRATKLKKYRIVFVKGDNSLKREPKMAKLIKEVESQLIRRRFVSMPELITGIYASLVEYLCDQGLLRFGPFDAEICEDASFKDLSTEKLNWFLRRARDARVFPLDASASSEDILTQLRLTRKGKLTNAAVLLFAKEPQRFIYSSEIKCAHFHGTTIQKPIPFYQVYKGNLFDLVDQSVNFVLSKIDLAVGTRANGPEVPVSYEIPPEVITEAIVNAVAHRDYASTASVQVMLFADRFEVWSPGTLTSALTLTSLHKPHGSYPPNPLIAEPLYLTKYIERMGTGIIDMLERCKSFGLPEPKISLRDGFVVVIRRKKNLALAKVVLASSDQRGVKLNSQVTPQVTQQVSPQVARLIQAIQFEMSREEIQTILNLKDRMSFTEGYLKPALVLEAIERTIPDKPNSRLQKYRLTAKGKSILKKISLTLNKVNPIFSYKNTANKNTRDNRKLTHQVTPQVTHQEAPQVTLQVVRLLKKLKNEKSRDELQIILKLNDRISLVEGYLKPALAQGLIEQTIPSKPNSRLQKYRLTASGKKVIKGKE